MCGTLGKWLEITFLDVVVSLAFGSGYNSRFDHFPLAVQTTKFVSKMQIQPRD